MTPEQIPLTKNTENKKVYFVSDSHFGVPDHERSLVREQLFIRWLDEVKKDAHEIYIMGDLFEFWFEYKTVIQKGYVRLLGKLAEITDAGIPVYFFRGNHDVWAFNYLKEELGFQIYADTLVKQIFGKTFYLGHGDGLGKGDKGYKFLKKIFRNRFNQWIFRWLHPDIGTALGLFWSNQSRVANINAGLVDINKIGIERIAGYCRKVLKTRPEIDYFIFGHVHQPEVVELNAHAKYFSIGDWIQHFSYLEFDGDKLLHKYYK